MRWLSFYIASNSAMFGTAFGQSLVGTFERPIPAEHIVLYETRGNGHLPMDSVSIDRVGRFDFGKKELPPGFYQIGVNGNDRVDFVVDPADPVIEFAFHGTPLQRNINVLRSGENQRLWAFKLKSREGQALLNELQQQREEASPLDTALLRHLERREMNIRGGMARALDSLISIAPNGQFAYAVNTDRRLENAVTGGPPLIRKEFNFSEPRSLRSSAYAKAILAYLQTTQFTSDDALQRASDTLLLAASGDTACWVYAREQLMDMFSTYGPDDVAQYLVDRYVVGPGALAPPDGRLLQLAAEQLRLVNGASAPDMILVDPRVPDTLHLSSVLPEYAFSVLFFYSSTCDHCHAQMAGLRQLVLDMKPSDLHLIGIAFDVTLEEFTTTLEEERINWPCFTELKAWGAQGAKDFNVKATPTFFILDRMGKIRAKPMDHEEVRTFLERNLE
ncbi:MAG: redoxin domain-containing protein [Flavobacteriales bacterium]|nr:redoxin domain-containing protein [Flavobacteriales bacterium]